MNNDSERPSIIVGVENGTAIPQNAAPLFNGIEEEQIPVAVREIDIDNVVSRAYQSALASRLSVGIAFDGDRFIVHYKNLKENKPLFDKTISVDVSILASFRATLTVILYRQIFKKMSTRFINLQN